MITIQHGDERLTVDQEQWAQMQASGMFSLWRIDEQPTEQDQIIKRGPGRPPKEKSDAPEERL